MEAIVGDFLKSPSASRKITLLDCFAHPAERGEKGLYGIEAVEGRNRRENPGGLCPMYTPAS